MDVARRVATTSSSGLAAPLSGMEEMDPPRLLAPCPSSPSKAPSRRKSDREKPAGGRSGGMVCSGGTAVAGVRARIGLAGGLRMGSLVGSSFFNSLTEMGKITASVNA